MNTFIHNFNTEGDFLISGSFVLPSQSSGFAISLGESVDEEFVTGVSVLGREGFILDGLENFVGGYSNKRQTDFELHVFRQQRRASLFVNESLMLNNASIEDLDVNALEFKAAPNSSASFAIFGTSQVFQEPEEIFYILNSNGSYRLVRPASDNETKNIISPDEVFYNVEP
jgi:hypothetical protein